MVSTLFLSKARNSKKQGDIGLVVAIAWFELNGYPVLVPLTDSQDYDLGVDIEGKLHRVQVRTTYYKKDNGTFVVNLLVSGGNRSGTGRIKRFDAERFDYLFVVTDNGDRYLIPASKITASRSLTLGEKYAEYLVE